MRGSALISISGLYESPSAINNSHSSKSLTWPPTTVTKLKLYAIICHYLISTYKAHVLTSAGYHVKYRPSVRHLIE